MTKSGLIDEKFSTISPLEVGVLPPFGTEEGEDKNVSRSQRPTTFMVPGFSKEDAPWWHWISCRRVADHQFSRYRRIR